MKIYSHIIIVISICLLFSCKQGKTTSVLNKESLFNHYTPQDSLKQKAIRFILSNIDSHHSDIPIFINRLTEKETPFDLASIENDIVLMQTLEELNLRPSFKMTSDTSLINNDFLIRDIELAFSLWNKYPWANEVSFNIFLNYLLPYKIYGEEPADWRSFFVQRYQDAIGGLLNSSGTDTITTCSNEVYYWFLENDLDNWFVYEANPVQLTRHSCFNELMALKSGDCYGWSYLNVMILRSLGIPSTIDYVPLWGRGNGTHQSEVFWDNKQGRFRTASAREFRFPAKVLRYTFERQGTWTDSIRLVIKQQPFVLDFLKHNHWLDVTHEHTTTATIEYDWDFPTDFAYICVLNYGQWDPVYWGKIENGKVRFENMGTDMFYRIAKPVRLSYELVSPIFHLNETGNKTFFKPDLNKKINLQLSKLNTGALSWVETGKSYNLYYYDENNDWTLFQTQQSGKDSLIVFDGVPSNTLYWLWDIERERRLERPFMYENGEQVFF
ncbi:MAG: hypothetical protein LBI15_05755 [Dysgonamonadaceae bacterium]|jgi:hypothetical protein|nr:hypothetical protein [Dysgonamonadaceae bacterium]